VDGPDEEVSGRGPISEEEGVAALHRHPQQLLERHRLMQNAMAPVSAAAPAAMAE